MINELADKVRAATQRELQNPKFLDTEIDCLGPRSAVRITQDLAVDEYWFWNLRNTVRFDKAIAAALPLGVDTFVELAEHPTLQLAIHDNLAALTGEDERATMVVGTSTRTAFDLGEFTRNLAQLAVHDLDYPWDCLGTESDGPPPAAVARLPEYPDERGPAVAAVRRPVLPQTATGRRRRKRSTETTPARLSRRGVGSAVASFTGAAARHRHR